MNNEGGRKFKKSSTLIQSSKTMSKMQRKGNSLDPKISKEKGIRTASGVSTAASTKNITQHYKPDKVNKDLDEAKGITSSTNQNPNGDIKNFIQTDGNNTHQDGEVDGSICCNTNDLETTKDRIAFMSQSPKFNKLPLKTIILPRKNKKMKLLVLDLDETLVHCSYQNSSTFDHVFNLEIDKKVQTLYIDIRPGVDEFLEKMCKIYEIAIFTSGASNYADRVINLIDPKQRCLHRLYRDHCTKKGNSLIKNLHHINRKISEIIIVDNSPLCFSLNKENGLPIKSWFFDKNDRELYQLTPILEFLSGVNDVREYIPKFTTESNKIEFNLLATIRQIYESEHQQEIKQIDDTKMLSNFPSAQKEYYTTKYLNNRFTSPKISYRDSKNNLINPLQFQDVEVTPIIPEPSVNKSNVKEVQKPSEITSTKPTNLIKPNNNNLIKNLLYSTTTNTALLLRSSGEAKLLKNVINLCKECNEPSHQEGIGGLHCILLKEVKDLKPFQNKVDEKKQIAMPANPAHIILHRPKSAYKNESIREQCNKTDNLNINFTKIEFRKRELVRETSKPANNKSLLTLKKKNTNRKNINDENNFAYDTSNGLSTIKATSVGKSFNKSPDKKFTFNKETEEAFNSGVSANLSMTRVLNFDDSRKSLRPYSAYKSKGLQRPESPTSIVKTSQNRKDVVRNNGSTDFDPFLKLNQVLKTTEKSYQNLVVKNPHLNSTKNRTCINNLVVSDNVVLTRPTSSKKVNELNINFHKIKQNVFSIQSEMEKTKKLGPVTIQQSTSSLANTIHGKTLFEVLDSERSPKKEKTPTKKILPNPSGFNINFEKNKFVNVAQIATFK